MDVLVTGSRTSFRRVREIVREEGGNLAGLFILRRVLVITRYRSREGIDHDQHDRAAGQLSLFTRRPHNSGNAISAAWALVARRRLGEEPDEVAGRSVLLASG